MDIATYRNALMSVALTAGLIAGCSSSDDDETAGDGAAVPAEPTAPAETPTDPGDPITGLISLSSVRSVPEAVGELETSLMGNPNIRQLPAIDHQANASGIGETLRPTTVKLFGNPELGTPLMQVNQLAGLDLPQKILFWEDAASEVRVGYNSASYLRNRHAITGADDALDGIDNALAMLAGNAAGVTSAGAGSAVDDSADSAVEANEGIVTVTSTQDIETTYNALLSAIEGAAPLTLVAEVDHQANAIEVGLELPPTRLVIFGNPNLGTPLMQSRQTVGIDLPQKMLVFETDDNEVTIAYNDPFYLAARHGVTGQDATLEQISTALAGLANGAAGTPAEQ